MTVAVKQEVLAATARKQTAKVTQLALNLTAEQKPGVSFDSRGACLDRAEVPKQCALLMLGPHSPLESALLTRCCVPFRAKIQKLMDNSKRRGMTEDGKKLGEFDLVDRLARTQLSYRRAGAL